MFVLELNDLLVSWLNVAVGRSALVDTVIALPLRNELLKAVPVLACLLAVWHSGRPQQRLAQRKVLIATMMMATLAAGVSRAVSERTSLPRPYVFRQQVYALKAQGLVAQRTHLLRSPRDNASRERANRLADANIPANDFGAFPSDHAALFFTIACGVWVASRKAGVLALTWTFVAILLPKVWVGMHSPLDIVGGCLLGGSMLAAFLAIQERFFLNQWRRAVQATLRHEEVAAALVFVYAFEASSTFDHVAALVKGITTQGLI